jgi:hypothetical protein
MWELLMGDLSAELTDPRFGPYQNSRRDYTLLDNTKQPLQLIPLRRQALWTPLESLGQVLNGHRIHPLAKRRS